MVYNIYKQQIFAAERFTVKKTNDGGRYLETFSRILLCALFRA